VENKDVLHRGKKERYSIDTIKWRKANRTGHILRRNCFLKHATEGKIKELRRQRRIR
jgi:hypothetical protein